MFDFPSLFDVVNPNISGVGCNVGTTDWIVFTNLKIGNDICISSVFSCKTHVFRKPTKSTNTVSVSQCLSVGNSLRLWPCHAMIRNPKDLDMQSLYTDSGDSQI